MTCAPSGINARPNFDEGRTLSHTRAWGAEIACDLAFVTVLASEKRELKSSLSSFYVKLIKAAQHMQCVTLHTNWQLANVVNVVCRNKISFLMPHDDSDDEVEP